jgi:NADH-quinone oxidoreductase subunit I
MKTASTIAAVLGNLPGAGIAKGMVETARNFLGSYYDPERLTTVQYPDERVTLKENFRHFPFLVYDGEDPEKGLRCVACKICEKECPPQCIYIVAERDDRGKLLKHPKVFDIDASVCMGCQVCVEVCPFDSIKMDAAYEFATQDRFKGLLLHKPDLAKPNSYYRGVRPIEAAEADARIAIEQAKAQGRPKPAAPAS